VPGSVRGVALTLTVDRARWREHVAATRAAFPGLVPVVKGNGYGFGLTYLAELVSSWEPVTAGERTAGEQAEGELALGTVHELAVGTVHELAGLPADGPRPLVLTPALARELPIGVGPAVLTVGSERHVGELASAGLHPPVIVKLASPMRRYGVAPDDLPGLLAAVDRAGLPVHGFAVHPPLAGSSDDHVEAIRRWLPALPADALVYASHLDAAGYAAVRAAGDDDVRWRIRLGTALWHGDKSSLHLTADVLDVRPVRGGDRVGYRAVAAPADGSLVMVTAGTAHGVHPLAGGQSPFHFARERLRLVEPSHMHTSMCFVAADSPCPEVGDVVDVQHPLTQTLVDRILEI
jgi:alanine racemase